MNRARRATTSMLVPLLGVLAVCLVTPAQATAQATTQVTAQVTAQAAAQAPATFTPTPGWPKGGYTRLLKVRLLDALPQPPELVVFGGSRAMKAEPSWLASLTGLRSFNAAVSSSRPTDVWAFVNLLHAEYPTTPEHYVWFLSMEAFREVGIVQDQLLVVPRLARYLPRELVPHDVQPVPPGALPRGDLIMPDRTVWAHDGWLVTSRYELAFSRGATLQGMLGSRIRQYSRNYQSTFTKLYDQPKELIARVIEVMNGYGATPVIVLPPYHPDLLAALEPLGWDARHKEVLAYFADLRRSCRFVLVDLSDIASFHGRPDGFYDGVHLSVGMMRRMLGVVVERAGAALLRRTHIPLGAV